MSQRKEVAEEAVRNFVNGYNCAQSVLLTFASRHKVRSVLIPKIATGFGSGISRCGSVCGALTGGVMSAGIRYGTNKPSQKERVRCYELARELYTKFEQRHGTVLCKELIGYDLSRAEELDEAKSERVFEKKCPSFVRTVIQILMDFEMKNKPCYSEQKSHG